MSCATDGSARYRRLRIGTSGWSYKHWQNGAFYPTKLPAAEQLPFYARLFSTVELNNTFYRTPSASMWASWVERTPDDFVFSVKLGREITHEGRLVGVGGPLEAFVEGAMHLGPKLGPLLVQLPPSFEADLPTLEEFLELMPPGIRAAFEFRHESWFAEPVYEALARHNQALVIADSPDHPSAEVGTADWVYLRLHGHERMYHSWYNEAQLEEWAGKINGWIGEEKEAFVYFDNDVEIGGPPNAKRLMEILGAEYGEPLPEPEKPRAVQGEMDLC